MTLTVGWEREMALIDFNILRQERVCIYLLRELAFRVTLGPGVLMNLLKGCTQFLDAIASV